jgi:ferrous iron transport protein A
MSTSILNLKPGDVIRICGYRRGSSLYRRRLLAMGLTKGVEFTVERIAPLGDPIQIKIRNFSLTLRKREADLLQIERINHHEKN